MYVYMYLIRVDVSHRIAEKSKRETGGGYIYIRPNGKITIVTVAEAE